MKYSFPCVQGVTKGFREDVALREGYWKEGFSLETATKSASQSCWGGKRQRSCVEGIPSRTGGDREQSLSRTVPR